MKKTIKKLFASFCAVVLAVSAANVPSAVVKAEGETTAYLSFADNNFAVQYWFDGNDYAPVVAKNAAVNGYGQYTVSLDLSGVDGGVAPDMAFMDVEIKDGETLYPNSFMQIDSVKINGSEVELGRTYTSSDNGTDTRTNIYNAWANDIPSGRTADGDKTDCTATPLAGDTIKDIKTIEVTFTLGDGIEAFANTIAAPVAAKELPAEGTTSYLSMADSAFQVQYWFDGNDYSPVAANNTMVTGYGQYTVSLDFSGVDGGVCPDMAFLDVEIEGGEQYFPDGYMQIDSVKINGEEVALGKTYTNSDDGVATRTNLYNAWANEVKGRTLDGDLTDCTPTPVAGDTFKDIKTVEVTYTLMQGVGEAAAEEEYVMPADFNAFMMFADGSGAWENYNPGVAGDAKILGDGRWEVTTTAAQIGATGPAVPTESALVFLVDIEGLGDAMKHLGTLREAADGSFTDTDAKATVEVYVDGNKVSTKNDNIIMGDLEDNGRLRLELFNAYGSGTKDNPVVMANALNPTDEIKVIFTLEGTGLNTGADISAPAEEAPPVEAEAPVVAEPEESKGVPPIVVVAIVVVVAAAAAGGYVYISKKKGSK